MQNQPLRYSVVLGKILLLMRLPPPVLILLLVFRCTGFCGQAINPPVLPDPKLTPGDVLPVTKADICVVGYTEKVRHVTDFVAEKVWEEYHIEGGESGEFEIDHLISLELGGSNSIKNLWPQSYKTEPWNARVKDGLEHHLHSLVCKGQLDLKTAQHDIATDWIAAYKKYMKDSDLVSAPYPKNTYPSASPWPLNQPPLATAAPSPSIPPTPVGSPAKATDAKVWVNTNSGIYFFKGSGYYGTTAEGEYMTQAEALQKGYRPTKSHQ